MKQKDIVSQTFAIHLRSVQISRDKHKIYKNIDIISEKLTWAFVENS